MSISPMPTFPLMVHDQEDVIRMFLELREGRALTGDDARDEAGPQRAEADEEHGGADPA